MICILRTLISLSVLSTVFSFPLVAGADPTDSPLPLAISFEQNLGNYRNAENKAAAVNGVNQIAEHFLTFLKKHIDFSEFSKVPIGTHYQEGVTAGQLSDGPQLLFRQRLIR